MVLSNFITSLSLLLAAPEGVAKGPDALTLLEYPETRNQFIDELMEVPSSSGRTLPLCINLRLLPSQWTAGW